MITDQRALRILITGGRAPVALEWCRLLHAAGHEVYVAESFPQPLCRYSNTVQRCYSVPAPRQQPGAFLSELERIVCQEQIDLLLPTCEEIFHIADGLESLSKHVRVISPMLTQLHRLHHKGAFIELVRAAGLLVPDTVLLENEQQWRQTQLQAWQDGRPIVLKPAYSRFASQVWLPPESYTGGTRKAELTKGAERELEKGSLSELRVKQEAEQGLKLELKPEARHRFGLKTELGSETGIEVETETGRKSGTKREINPKINPEVKRIHTSSTASPSLNESNSGRWNSYHAPPPATLSKQQPWIAQQFIAGEQLCTYSIVHEGTVVAHATYRCRYRNSRAGASVHFEALERPDTLEWVQTLMSRWNELDNEQQDDEDVMRSSDALRRLHRFNGQLSFDLIEQQHTGKLYPLECNPRATSGVHLFRPEDGLEQALLYPAELVANGTIIQPQPGRRVMLTLPMLVSGLGRRWSRQQWRQWRESLRSAEDAIYRHYDRMPAYGQLRLLWAAWRISRRERISIVEALTHDIEWNGIDAGSERS